MSNETILTTIEIVKKKLRKYIALKEHGKVKEYLRQLHRLSLNPSLIQETKIDILIRKLASHKTAIYNSTARHLLKKWHQKKRLPKSTKTEMMTEKKSDHNRTNTNERSESQSSDDNKKRKVLSLAEYLESKKHVLSPSSTNNSTQRRFTDTQIEVIHAQFQATTEKLTASASDLANIVNKNLIEVEKLHDQRISKKPSIVQSKSNDLWAEDDDDDDDDDDNKTQSKIIQSRTMNSTLHIQKVQ